MKLSVRPKSSEQASPSLGWWLQVDTQNPIGIRYFGPFRSQEEAESLKYKYCLDLTHDHIRVLDCRAKFCQPRQLVIDENHLHMQDLEDASLQLFMSLIRDR